MYEEADFGYRILKAGFKAFIFTDARTSHLSYVGDGENDVLRVLGIGFPERAYHFAKNRYKFMKTYAKWYHLIVFYLIFEHIFNAYYIGMAIKYKRSDIAVAWMKGMIKGFITKADKAIKVDI